MNLFQKSVEKKFLTELDDVLIDSKYAAFQEYFGNPERQKNIRNSKEEQFQEGFLRELFVNILGYTLNPEPEFNLTTELKNVSNSRKVDGAVLNDNGDAIAVIELKSTNTTDLDTIETQAFGYKNHQPKCVYVITSNFEKLRFYIEDAIDYLDFDLFQLSRDQFALLYLCLSKDSLLNDLPLQIKKSSVLQEEDVTKKLYTDYSAFRKAVFNNLIKNNPDKDKLLLFKKTQKLLDRFLFIFFAEDRSLLPPNSISIVIEQWKSLKDLDEYVPLFTRFKKYFGYMDTGFKGKKYDIFAYNGGLFKPDEILDNILIDDEILLHHTKKLSAYDFESDVDVNILGHIFEHSLVEIESIHAEINGSEIDSQKSKRKKDGIFYTPKYITQYIVENTIGRLCKEKRSEMFILDEDYARGRKNRQKATVVALDKKLIEYRDWLLNLTILDPACGSGAFLNQALDFLINEHQKINDLDNQLHDENLGLHDIEKDILERNIYGVDINEESVEIAKLSLWLRTAQKGRKLNTLTDNIKCGNSLIDDPEVAGDKAFNWQKEYPDVFANGGFDVVIGNPPYGAKLEKSDKDFLKKNYRITEYNYDTYNFFFELSLNILKNNSLLGFITPNTFLVVENGVLLRKLLFQENRLIELYETFNVFPDAVVEPITAIIQKTPSKKENEFNVLLNSRDKTRVAKLQFKHEHVFEKKSFVFNYRETEVQRSLYSKISKNSKPLISFAKVTTGVKPYQTGKGTPKQSKEIVQSKPFTSFELNEGWFPLVRGTQINKYITKWDGEVIKYGNWLAEPRNPEIFFKPKLLIRRTDDNLLCTFDDKNYVGINSVHCIQSFTPEVHNKYLLALINSKLCNWFFQHDNFHMVGKPLAEIKVVFVERLPIVWLQILGNLLIMLMKLLLEKKELYH